jgi:chemotaxis protein CheC
MSDNQRDALLEIFNVGVGHAAASLSLIVKDEVSMSVPRIEVLLDKDNREDSTTFDKDRICAVTQHFTGPFDAEAMLIFPENKTMLIVQKMVGEDVAAEDLSEMEQDALSEIGNIILNTCISTIGDMFQHKFSSSTPTYRVGIASEIVNAPASSESVVLLLHIEFFLKQDQIHGYLVLLLNVHSYARLLESIDVLLARYST